MRVQEHQRTRRNLLRFAFGTVDLQRDRGHEKRRGLRPFGLLRQPSPQYVTAYDVLRRKHTAVTQRNDRMLPLAAEQPC
jgi:hypothetical protein